jgi:hypothetical protein
MGAILKEDRPGADIAIARAAKPMVAKKAMRELSVGMDARSCNCDRSL